MIGEYLAELVVSIRDLRLEPSADAIVQLGSIGFRQRSVRDVADQQVLEAERATGGIVTIDHEEALADQSFRSGSGFVVKCEELIEGEALADDTRALQAGLLRRR